MMKMAAVLTSKAVATEVIIQISSNKKFMHLEADGLWLIFPVSKIIYS